MEPMRIGIIGCGGIARAHRDTYRELGARIVAAHDAVPAATAAFAGACGARAVDSVEALLAAGVDAISCCSPPGAHLASCLPVIAAGIPLLCEKPLAASLADARAIAAAARGSRAPVMVGFCHRFHGPVIELQRLVRAGRLGRPVLMRLGFSGEFALAGNHRGDPELAGGGCVMDNGAHALDLFRVLVGDIAEVRGLVGKVVQRAAVEDVGAVLVRSVDGALGDISTSFSVPVGCARLEWYGSGGSAILTWYDEVEPELRWRAKGDAGWTVVDCSAHPDRFRTEIAAFLAAARARTAVRPSAEDGLAVNEAIAAAYASSRPLAGAARG